MGANSIENAIERIPIQTGFRSIRAGIHAYTATARPISLPGVIRVPVYSQYTLQRSATGILLNQPYQNSAATATAAAQYFTKSSIGM